jgi:hypothetical protein
MTQNSIVLHAKRAGREKFQDCLIEGVRCRHRRIYV